MKFVLIIVIVLGVSFGAKFPSDWKSCKGSEDLGKCLASAMQDILPKMKNGVADFGVPPLEPVNIPSVTIGQGTGSVNVVQNYKNFQIFGISTAKIPKIDGAYTSEGLTMDIKAFIPEIKILADYELNGRILLLPIVGKGKCKIILKDMDISVKVETKQFAKNGKKYLKVTSTKVELNPVIVVYNFENLFGGDKRLSDEIDKIVNANSKIVFNEVKSGYENVLETVFTDYADKVFSKIATDELF